MANEISTSVLLNEQEARAGIVLELPLPDGRTTSVTIPAGVRNGQVLQFPAHVPSVREGGQPDTLMVTVYVEQSEAAISPSLPDNAVLSALSGNMPQPAVAPVPPGYPPAMGSAPFPPPGAYPQGMQPYPASQPPQRKQHIARNIMIVTVVLVTLLSACVGLFVWSVNQLTANQTAQTRQIWLDVQGTERARQQATTQTAVPVDATANPNPYLPGEGTLLFQDKMDGSPIPNTPGAWQIGSHCKYQDGKFHIVHQSSNFASVCALQYAPGPDGTYDQYPMYKNVTVEFKMSILEGDIGGIDFRMDGHQGYNLIFDSKGNGQLLLLQGSKQTTLSHGLYSAFHKGFDQENTIGLVVADHSIAWFVNGKLVGAVK